MKKLLKVLTITLAAAALVGVLLSAAYTQTVSDELTRLRRESRSDIVYLRTRVRELEGELTSLLADYWGGSIETGGRVETDTLPSTSEEDTPEDPSEDLPGDLSGDLSEEQTDDSSYGDGTDADTDVSTDEESVTIPTHNSPETQPTIGETEDTESPVAAYLLTVHNGMIGVLDASGELVRTVNVFVMTLPEIEQEALAVGIPAYSEEEMLAILERYQ